MKKVNAWTTYDKQELQKLDKITNDYKKLLDKCKTERECVTEVIALAQEQGYKSLKDIMESKETIQPGDKVYHEYMGRSIMLYHIGSDPLEEGMNILGAHIDSPRIDVKQIPLFEDKGHVYLDTHYYGGIKKYQWLSTPLALHGVVVKKDGEKVVINIGENQEDPVFVITDILPHLGYAQAKKTAGEFVNGEKLDLLIGTKPSNNEEDDEKEQVKKNILNLLKERYNFEEDDFMSAELEIVPAGKVRDCGFDRSMIIGYGQDDRVCSFTSLFAMFQLKEVKRTACCIMADKEEIGSVGATGMASRLFENSVSEVMDRAGQYDSLRLKRALANSHMLSADVSAAYDPLYPECFESRNSAFLGNGLVFNKYTGSRGKSGSNDANPEYMAQIRKVMEDNQVVYQTAELGAVDIGGGGTIAYMMAEYGMDVIDSGVAVLGMHAPYEVTSKADVYEAYKGYLAFIKDMK